MPRAEQARIAVVISSLGPGGAERVATELANAWAERGHSVLLVTIAGASDDFYRIDPRVRRIGLDLMAQSRGLLHAIAGNARRVRALRRTFRATRPDVVVGFMETANVLTVLATRRLDVRAVVAQRIDPREEPNTAPWRLLRRVAYRLADAIVVQTSAVAKWAKDLAPRTSVHVIPNAVRLLCDDNGGAHTRSLEVLGIGRLTRQKGFDVLVRAFARTRSSHPRWSLRIAGEGEERPLLESLARELGVADVVRFHGRVAAPGELYRAASIFVLSSRYEGFPNVLVEAMACGLPVIASDCRSGPADIVSHGVDGLLVPPQDEASLANALDRLMASAAERERLGARAVAVRDRFARDPILARWDEALGLSRHA